MIKISSEDLKKFLNGGFTQPKEPPTNFVQKVLRRIKRVHKTDPQRRRRAKARLRALRKRFSRR